MGINMETSGDHSYISYHDLHMGFGFIAGINMETIVGIYSGDLYNNYSEISLVGIY